MPRTTIRSDDITDAQVKTADMAVDPTNATNLTSGSVPAAQLTNSMNPVEDDIAVLGFQVAAASDLAKYSLRDQIVDTFQDATGVDASASTNELRDSTGKYWSGGTESLPTGGTTTDYTSGAVDYRSHTFLASGNFVVTSSGDVDALIVAGGGGGGRSGGGGGAGGMQAITGIGVTAQTYSIVVGTGGAGNNVDGQQATDGVNSTALGQTASVGGGGGGSYGANGRNGGSGGGAAVSGTANPAGTGTAGQGNAGGVNFAGNPPRGGGSGGGAGAVGGAGTSGVGGTGGIGVQNAYKTGANIYYAGGGGGAGTSSGGPGGQGGGGDGKTTNPAKVGGNGTDGLGGGAGGGHDTTGGEGGDGTVIIRYDKAEFMVTGANLTLVSTATTAEAGTTGTGDVVMLYTPSTGTTTLNTDLKAYVSRDNGTTYTQATLVGKGSYSGTTEIASAHDLDISAQPAGVAMRWKVETLNQSAGVKETRINGMSLGWS